MDETLHRGYEEAIRAVVSGARRVSPMWPAFFSETSGAFADRIAQVFQTNGCVPTRTQFERERTLLLYADPEPAVASDEPRIAEPVAEPEAVAEAVEEAPSKPKPRKKPEAKEDAPDEV